MQGNLLSQKEHTVFMVLFVICYLAFGLFVNTGLTMAQNVLR